MNLKKPDLLVIGSGLYGLTIARRYVDEFDGRVLIIEKRKHIGGNAWSTKDEDTGIEIHNYGSHLFHTSNKRVIEFLGRFAGFNDYKHTVYSVANGKMYSMPFNLMTVSQVFNKSVSPEQAKIIIQDEINMDYEIKIDDSNKLL
jgi:UDP-galactopyranose mutase